MEKTNEEQPNMIDKILSLKENLLDDCKDIRSLVITAIKEDSDQPVVIYHGDQLEYTALAVTVAKVLRQRILNRIDGNDVHVHQSQQTLNINPRAKQGNNQNNAGQD